MNVANQRKFVSHLMNATGAVTHDDLGKRLSLDPSVFSKLYNHPKPGIKLSTLVTISERTGIRVSRLAGWLAGETPP